MILLIKHVIVYLSKMVLDAWIHLCIKSYKKIGICFYIKEIDGVFKYQIKQGLHWL